MPGCRNGKDFLKRHSDDPKNWQMGLNEIKHFIIAKKTTTRVRGQLADGKMNKCQLGLNRELISKLYKELKRLIP